jgi:lipopolysaccharide export LptBFGC system permease protein LptF
MLPERVGRGLNGQPLLQVVTADLAAQLGTSPSEILAKRQRELLHEIGDALADIKAEINSRLVFGIGCVPMILIGIGLGILQRGGHLLSAFGASCLPAAVLIIAIVSGKNLTQNIGAQSSSGILIMWAGLAFLILLTAVIYRKLRRS